MKKRNYADAIRGFRSVISMTGVSKELKLIQSKTFNNLGIIYYYQGSYDSALNCFEKSVDIKKQFLSPGDPLLINSFINAGVVYINLGDYDKALEYFNSAEKEISISGVAVDDLMSTILMNKGVVFKRQGDYEKTKMFFTRVKNIYMKDSSKYADKLPSLYFNLAAVEMGVHNYHTALSNLIECKRLSEQNAVRLIPKIDDLLARVYTSTGRTELAGKKYMDAISVGRTK